MLRLELDHEYRTALIHRGDQALEIAGPHGAFVSLGDPGAVWTYARFDSDTGITHENARESYLLAHQIGVSGAEQAAITAAADALTRASMTSARIRWEYRDHAGERRLLPVDFYLPLPPGTAQDPAAPRPTSELAKTAGLHGWNLRCNRCGGYGASWVAKERPGWGAAALCVPHASELQAERSRHEKALSQLRAVAFDQDKDRVDWRAAALRGSPAAYRPATPSA